MARAKKETKPSSPAPKRKKRRLFNSQFQKSLDNLQKRFEKHQIIYSVAATLLVLVLLVGVLFIFKKEFFVAGSVNGRFITTPEFYNHLVRVGGADAFDSIVREIIVKQEAQKRDFVATSEDVDKKIAEIEKRLGGKEAFSQALSTNNTSIEELRKQLATQVLVEKILEKEIQVSDSEVGKYMKDNKVETKGRSKEEVKEELKLRKLNEKFPAWYDEVKNKARIQKFF